MRRPIKWVDRLVVFLPVLSIVALVPIILTGFMSAPGEKTKSASDNSIINIEDLMKDVLQLNQSREYQKAIDLLLVAIDKQGQDSLLRTLLVQTFDLFLEEQIKLGQKDILDNRRNKEAYARVAGSLELLGDNFRAMEILLNGIRFNPKATDLWMKIGKLELKANRDMEALDVFREVIRLDNNNSDAFNNAAYILARSDSCSSKELKEAEKYANNARKIDPNNPAYLDTLAEVYFRKGDAKTAQNLIEQAIKLAPKHETFKNQLKRFKNDSSLMAE